MVSLSTQFTILPLDAQLATLNKMIEDTHPKITFSGKSIITTPKFWFTMDEVEEKILDIARSHLNADDLPIKERQAGVTLIERCRSWHKDLHTELNKCALITRLFYFIRQASSFLKKVISREDICISTDQQALDYLTAFSIKNFEKYFGSDKPNPAAAGWFWPPGRFCAKPEKLQELQ